MNSASESDQSVIEGVRHSSTGSGIDQLRSVIGRYPAISQAFVFGSVATGKVLPDSDLDIAVVWNGQVKPGQKMDLIKSLAEASGRPVDLVNIADCHGLLLKEILTKGLRLLPDDPHELFLLNKRLVYEEEDFMPMIRRTRRERASAFVNEH